MGLVRSLCWGLEEGDGVVWDVWGGFVVCLNDVLERIKGCLWRGKRGCFFNDCFHLCWGESSSLGD